MWNRDSKLGMAVRVLVIVAVVTVASWLMAMLGDHVLPKHDLEPAVVAMAPDPGRAWPVSRSSNRNPAPAPVDSPKPKPKPKPEPKPEPEPAPSVTNVKPVEGLPSLLRLIREHESGGNYTAYNASGCEGYGCGGAYQLHARYAQVWAARAGFHGLSSNAASWPAAVQDAVALKLFYSTSPDGSHWCRWTSYC